MTNLEQTLDTRFTVQFSPSTFLMRFGRREIFVCNDFRNRHYQVNPVIECLTGVQAGHLEILFFRKWLVILSKAR